LFVLRQQIVGLRATIEQVEMSLKGAQDVSERRRLALLLRGLQEHVQCLRATGQAPLRFESAGRFVDEEDDGKETNEKRV
jgi:hypothetical protein